MRGTDWTIDGLLIRLKLNQIARDEPRSHAEVAQGLNHQPGGIPTGTGGERERLLRTLNPGLEPDQIPNILLELAVQVDQKINRSATRTIDPGQPLDQLGPCWLAIQIGCQFDLQVICINERGLFGVGLQKEIKWIENRHLDDEIDRDRKLGHLFREHQTGHPVRKRILLPIHKVPLGFNT